MGHNRLHEEGFLFFSSSGNAETNSILEPLSFFAECKSCIVVGAHATKAKIPCIPVSFKTAGCCSIDTTITNGIFKQGVLTWTIGEGLVIPKVLLQQEDKIADGTSAACAIVAGTSTMFVPKLLMNPSTSFKVLKRGRILYGEIVKNFILSSSEMFKCPTHSVERNLIYPLI